MTDKYSAVGAADRYCRLDIDILRNSYDAASYYSGPADAHQNPHNDDKRQHAHPDHQQDYSGKAHHPINESLQYQV